VKFLTSRFASRESLLASGDNFEAWLAVPSPVREQQLYMVHSEHVKRTIVYVQYYWQSLQSLHAVELVTIKIFDVQLVKI